MTSPSTEVPEVQAKCVGPSPCIEVTARWTAAVDAWLDGCDVAAVGLAQQAANYARLHELQQLGDGEVAR